MQVLAGGDAWRFAVDGKPCTAMERRYFLRILLMDPSGECDVMLSNDQVRFIILYDIKDINFINKYG